MLCQICGKREATFHFKEVINDKIRELHLCEECARKKGFLSESFFLPSFSLSSLIGGFTEEAEIPFSIASQVECPHCGLTYEQIREKGKIGCSFCYQTFKDYLAPLLERIHGHTRHLGKAPRGLKMSEKEKEIHKLRKELEDAVKQEEYEKAAVLRDKIRKLEKEKSE